MNYSNNISKQDVLMACDSVNIPTPLVKIGNLSEANKILAAIGQRMDSINLEDTDVIPDQMPDVTGMGAKDALYLLEKIGLDVGINGSGQVVEQSIPIGNSIRKGEKVSLRLHP